MYNGVVAFGYHTRTVLSIVAQNTVIINLFVEKWRRSEVQK